MRLTKAAHFRPQSFDHLTTVSSVGLSPAWGTCDTSQVVLVGVLGGFSKGTPLFAPPISFGCISLDWDVKLKRKR